MNPLEQQSQERNRPMRMGWYNFLIYFALWLGSALNLWNGIQTATVLVYGDNAAIIYGYLPSLRIVDILYGIFLLLCAAFGIYTRFMLAQYRKIGPTCLYVLYAAVTVMPLVYTALVGAILGANVFDADTLSSAAVRAAMLVVNILYFRKRKDLFVT